MKRAQGKSIAEHLAPLIGQVIRDITGVSVDTYGVEVVTDNGILSIKATREEFLAIEIGRKVEEKVSPADALAFMESRTVKTTRATDPNHHAIVFTDESEVRISSDPDVQHDQKLTYTIIKRVDEEVV